MAALSVAAPALARPYMLVPGIFAQPDQVDFLPGNKAMIEAPYPPIPAPVAAAAPAAIGAYLDRLAHNALTAADRGHTSVHYVSRLLNTLSTIEATRLRQRLPRCAREPLESMGAGGGLTRVLVFLDCPDAAEHGNVYATFGFQGVRIEQVVFHVGDVIRVSIDLATRPDLMARHCNSASGAVVAPEDCH